jgi:hypothetical protein
MNRINPIVGGRVGPQPGQGTAELFQEQAIDANQLDQRHRQTSDDAFVGQPNDGPAGRVPGAGH